MKTLSFNINEYVSFKLTPFGEEIYRKSYRLFSRDEQGYYKTQLWEVMQLFGEYFTMGFNSPIQDMLFLIDVKDLHQVSMSL